MSASWVAPVLALVAGVGAYLLVSDAGPDRLPRPGLRRRGERWLRDAGVGDVAIAEFAAVVVVAAMATASGAFVVFGGVIAPALAGAVSATSPLGMYRARRRRALLEAHQAWPHLLEELRILTGSVGRSIPQALFEVGRRAPDALRPAFDDARRDWVLTTDFERAVTTLKEGLADPTADAVCETLLVAHTVGGTDLDRRLEALIEDRILDVSGRKDAAARQAGARFARRFVLVVPLGMAAAGMSIGTGRAAYASAGGQLMVGIGMVLTAACWIWAGRIMALPAEERVFDR